MAIKLDMDMAMQLAPRRARERGREYFEDGQVIDLAERKGLLIAKVEGSRTYTVKMTSKADQNFHYSCTCPMGAEGEFCKHCVAVALAWIEGREVKQTKNAKEIGLQDIETYLKTLDLSILVEILMEQAHRDETLRRKLFLKTARALSSGFDFAYWKRVIKEAFDTQGFVNYHEASSFTDAASQTVDDIDELLEGRCSSEVISLAEYAIERAGTALESMDDSNGEMGEVLNRLQNIHFKACRKVKPDPARLAKRLFHLELNSQFDEFYGAVKTYAPILGKAGLDAYRNLANQEWAKIPPGVNRWNAREKQSHTVYRLFHIMETLAELSGDVEQLVAIKKRDLSSAYNYLTIAEIYKKAGNRDKALEWAEAGIKAFPERTDARLREFLADEYHRRKRHEEALNLISLNFVDYLSLDRYQQLKQHADKTDAWPFWREKMMKYMQTHLTKQKKEINRWSYDPGYSVLVEIFLWEKNPEAAWEAANAGGCSQAIWMKLAAIRGQDYPMDSVGIYRKFVGPMIEQTNNQAYEDAIQLIKKIQAIMNRLGKENIFSGYVTELRTKYKAKRNFIKLLDQIR
ncbi:MAG TPA: SWIM zinc finger family protein [Smithellaceae bacterium]|nr:MAG: hypothetical protein BWX45_00299 [Deltaproteobacteria bacterium ADurb.Bin002]HNV56663.1 SWIM zinc finger family protein [Smithellaceae bacterium]HPI51829.1 SWIM zinc finger family protein [Smithellaceae bacterium]HPM21840.1 SWIM zinc finger family protein [Thermotogota bacterium]HPV71913.1 SWIM zinc finger family protein [Smithellaceae bacterium]